LREDCINRLVEWPRVCFPVEIKCVTIRPRFDVVGHHR
jgi:hypothetical protein